MDVTAALRGFGHGPAINNGPAEPGQREPTMTAYLHQHHPPRRYRAGFAASFSALSSTASFAFSAEAQAMCTGDAFRLCSDEIPNIPKITACMIKKRASLSTGCRAVMDRDLAARSPARSPRSNLFVSASGNACVRCDASVFRSAAADSAATLSPEQVSAAKRRCGPVSAH